MKTKLLLTITLTISILQNITAQSLTSSNLPIIIINTLGATIVDEPKIKTEFKIIYNGEGKINKITDSPNHYNGLAGIEIRGSSSQLFPKKGYGIELWDDKLDSKDVSLFGMPKESDWVLFASYNEKSFMHNVLTMRIAREMGMYATRTQYVELVINNEYRGVYVFEEKVKRATGRVEIAKLKETDLGGDDITGGYIFKADKDTGSKLGGWRSKYLNFPEINNNFTYFQYDSPNTITFEQKTYLKNYVDTAEESLQNANFRDKTNGYRKYFDTRSFIQMFIVNEVSKNVDGYRISSYFSKDKDSKGGKIKSGPPWDYDISYGNANYCEGDSPYGFSYLFNKTCPQDYWQVPYFWEKMLSDSAFVRELGQEYGFQRKYGALQLERINKHIDTLTNILKESMVRNFQKWPILGVYVWPQPTPIATNWYEEIDELKRYLVKRLDWLDNNIKTNFAITANEPSFENISISAFPNPFLERININIQSKIPEKANIILLDNLGKQLYNSTQNLQVGDNDLFIQLPDYQIISGIKFLKIEINGKVVTKKLVQQ
jgi:hypothetical protein